MTPIVIMRRIMNPPLSLSRRSFLQSLALGGAGTLAFGAAPLTKLPTVNEEVRRAAQAAPLRLAFRGTTSADVAAWQKEFSAELRKRLGPHQPPEQWSVTELSRVEFPDYAREEYLLSADGVPSLPLYILKPLGTRHAGGSFPIVLALHGHGAFGHDSIAGVDDSSERAEDIRKQNNDYGRQLVREGYVVVAPCFTPFGRRLDESYKNSRTDPCNSTFVRMMLLGQTLMGANLRDAKWALSFAQARDDVRRDRIGCVGLSYGGRMTMLTTALDERVQVAVVSGALNVMQERIEGPSGCGAQVIPGLLEIGDTPEIGSLIAPRPCIWEVGSKDSLIKANWADVAKARLRKAYLAAEKPGHLEFHHFEGVNVHLGVAPKRDGLNSCLRRSCVAVADPRQVTEQQRFWFRLVEGAYEAGIAAMQDAAANNRAACLVERAVVDYLHSREDEVSRRVGKKIDLERLKPYSSAHNAGYTECQEFYGATTLHSVETFGKQIVVMLDVALRGIADAWDDVVIPDLDFVVVENTCGKFGTRLEEFNQVPRNVQHLVGGGRMA